MNEAEQVAMVEAAGLEAYPDAAAAMTAAAVTDDGWFGSDRIGRMARLVVAAWAVAVNGDDSILTRIADPDAARWLLHPVMRDWVIAPDPLVTAISVASLDVGANPPALRMTWQFTGRRSWAAAAERTEEEIAFVGNATLTLTGSQRWPWQLSSANVSTLDSFLGWTFDRRLETAAEYRERTGASAGTGMLIPTGSYVLNASFFDDDIRWGASAATEVSSDPEPTRAEAGQLVWPAIWARVGQSFAEGDCRPSLRSLRMIRLLGPAGPAVALD